MMITLIVEALDHKLLSVLDSLSYNLKEEVAFLDIQEKNSIQMGKKS